jgi:Bacterial PH domain
MSHDDFAFEPVRGLPERLPPGEELRWQGSPRWQSFAVHAFHIRKVAVYFGLLAIWSLIEGFRTGRSAHAMLVSCLWLALLGALAVAVLTVLAYASARSTVYSITSKRVVMRHGVAVSLSMNLPFALIDSAGYKDHGDGSGDIALTLAPSQRLGYIVTWPHVRRWRFTRPEPMLRCVVDAPRAAQILSAALGACPLVEPRLDLVTSRSRVAA